MKRICLFAGYDSDNLIQDYVVYYITELSKISDVYYLSDNNMSESELGKLAGITEAVFSQRHKKYDFGSWQELINKIGWDKIEKYDQLILANDSCYGPVFSFKDLFGACQNKYDFWGVTSSHQFFLHIQSYFLVMNKNIITNGKVRNFMCNIKEEKKRGDTILKYEVGLSKLIQEEKFHIGSYIENTTKSNMTLNPVQLIKQYNVPLVKVKAFIVDGPSMNLYGSIINTIKKYTTYNTQLIEKHILSKNISLQRNKLRVFINVIESRGLSSLFSCRRTKKGKLLIKIFKIPIFNFKI